MVNVAWFGPITNNNLPTYGYISVARPDVIQIRFLFPPFSPLPLASDDFVLSELSSGPQNIPFPILLANERFYYRYISKEELGDILGGGGAVTIDTIDFTSSINGVQTFNTPFIILKTIGLFVNGVIKEVTSYTVSVSSVTLPSALNIRIGDIIIFVYVYGTGTGAVAEDSFDKITLTASGTIPGHRAIMLNSSGAGVLADPTIAGYSFIGISTTAANNGQLVDVAVSGYIVEPSWNWIPDSYLFSSPNGVLTQTPPTSGISHIVAIAISATSVLIEEQSPIILAP